ncbi:TCTN1 [Symbiodinium natans]|uniref:TCTN1 protein n=1 Tax=Symbiodinium natans TaxID=878477 RepID=A0A812SLR6_9DINO|nr:TCTN1 [Symbiodinium natans]
MPPQHAQQLCAFARHRGAHLMYRVVRDTLSQSSRMITEGSVESMRDLGEDSVDVAPISCWPDHHSKSADGLDSTTPVLRRLRSDIKGRSNERSIRIIRRAASAPRSLHASNAVSSIESLPLASSLQADAKALPDMAHKRLSTQVLTYAYQTAAKQLLAAEAAVRASKSMQGFGKNLDHSSPGTEIYQTTCSICLEDAACVRSADELCVDRGCQGWFCRHCLGLYFETIIRETPFAVPTLRCPSCKGFVPPSCWQARVKEETVAKWQSNAENLLSLRCGSCDEPGSLLFPGPESSESRECLVRTAFGTQEPEAAAELEQKWHEFERGQQSAATLFEVLLGMWHPEYSHDTADGGKAPDDFWVHFSAAAKLIEDAGLRAVLQLAVLKVFPKTETRCCHEPHCFRCRIATHHEDMSCEEVQQQMSDDLEDGVQFCPSCGVATMKTEGCNHMICLCGEDWTWEGPEDE